MKTVSGVMVTITVEGKGITKLPLPPPSVLLALPDSKFNRWFPEQERAFQQIMDWYHSPARFVGVTAPTGSGKSILALLLSKFSGVRTVILTATRGLQDQYLADAAALGGVTVKGQQNFACPLSSGVTADQGACHDGYPCPHATTGECLYRRQLQEALSRQLVITNYAYYLAQTNYSSGLGEVGLLICDEGHQAFSSLENHLSIYINRLDVEPIGISFPEQAGDWVAWKLWAEASSPVASDYLAKLEAQVKTERVAGRPVPAALSHAYRTAKSVLARMGSISSAVGEWVIEYVGRGGFRFTPVWVSGYGGNSLFHSVPKIMLMSAILTPKMADIIGVSTDPASRSWVEVESSFSPQNSPIWHIPTARISYRTDEYSTNLWLARVDQLIDRRLDRKGIIFTVSYARRDVLFRRSRHAGIMISHSASDVMTVVNKFKTMPSPAVLVSPSITTGYDIPALATGCRYIIVGKVPYPDTSNPVMEARHRSDPDWSSFLAMGTLVQESGRATRGPGDRVEVLVVDDNARWFFWKFKQFAPSCFMARYRGTFQGVPDPFV